MRITRHVIWLLLTVAISAAFARLAVHNLANFRPVSNDEVELMEVGHQLATRGVLGSDMYAGFFGAEQHHLWTLPVQHFVDAATFKAFGAGVVSARAVSVLAAVICIVTIGWLAYRWYGLSAAILCELLMTCWASDLIAAQTTLPLLGVARAARYDMLALGLAWLTIAQLDVEVRRGVVSPPRAVLLGVCGGLATLAQFYAGAVLGVIVVGWLWIRGRSAAPGLVWSGLGAAAALVPWAAYIAAYWTDFVGQTSVYGTRGDFLQPVFYVRNMLTEPLRYAHLLDTDIARASSWFLIVATLPALAWIGWRARSRHAVGDRLLLTSALLFGGLLLVVDSTKTPLYAIALLPTICLALSGAWSHVVPWGLTRGYTARIAAAILSLAIVVPLASESLAAWQLDFAESGEVSSYLGTGKQIDAAIAPEAAILGPERWWWALHTHPYRSLRAVWFRWTAAEASGGSPQLDDLLLQADATHVIINNNVRDDIRAFPDALQQQFWEFVDRCTTLADVVDDPTYMRIEIYRMRDPRPESCRPYIAT
jgi:4-amino-4-deoxy-L-arabinose transferase-like glycosyltransferase